MKKLDIVVSPGQWRIGAARRLSKVDAGQLVARKSRLVEKRAAID
jgi:hypothetical protein